MTWVQGLRAVPEVRAEPVEISRALEERFAPGAPLRGRFVDLGRARIAASDVTVESESRGTFSETIDLTLDPPVLTRVYSERETSRRSVGVPAPGRVQVEPACTVRLRADGAAVASELPIHRGSVLLGLLPSGVWRAGTSRGQTPDDAAKVPTPFSPRGPEEGRLVDATTRFAYLGRDEEGRPRFRIVYSTAIATIDARREWAALDLVLDPPARTVRLAHFVRVFENASGGEGQTTRGVLIDEYRTED